MSTVLSPLTAPQGRPPPPRVAPRPAARPGGRTGRQGRRDAPDISTTTGWNYYYCRDQDPGRPSERWYKSAGSYLTPAAEYGRGEEGAPVGRRGSPWTTSTTTEGRTDTTRRVVEQGSQTLPPRRCTVLPAAGGEVARGAPGGVLGGGLGESWSSSPSAGPSHSHPYYSPTKPGRGSGRSVLRPLTVSSMWGLVLLGVVLGLCTTPTTSDTTTTTTTRTTGHHPHHPSSPRGHLYTPADPEDPCKARELNFTIFPLVPAGAFIRSQM